MELMGRSIRASTMHGPHPLAAARPNSWAKFRRLLIPTPGPRIPRDRSPQRRRLQARVPGETVHSSL